MESSGGADKATLSVSDDNGDDTASAAIRALLATLLSRAGASETDTFGGLP